MHELAGINQYITHLHERLLAQWRVFLHEVVIPRDRGQIQRVSLLGVLADHFVELIDIKRSAAFYSHYPILLNIIDAARPPIPKEFFRQ
ncbi:hypothetical protein D3C84_896030 [compost metagenome]